MRCFLLETNVILQECLIKNCSKTQDVLNIWKIGKASLENYKVSDTNGLLKKGKSKVFLQEQKYLFCYIKGGMVRVKANGVW